MTLNTIVSRIRALALAHDQVSSFYFGQPFEFDDEGGAGSINYPSCFLEILPGTINRTDHLQTFRFRMYLMDQVGVSKETEGNETEVLSDMSSVAADILAMLMNFDDQQDYLISPDTSFTPSTERFGDMIAGVEVDFGVSVDFLADRCQVPADSVTFEEDFDMARTRILTYTATGSEGNSFSVTNLAGKIVLAIYRAGMYKRAVTTTPTDTEKIKITGTDLGDRKGILASSSTVELSSGDSLIADEILDFLIYE